MKTEKNCPLCRVPLTVSVGDQTHSGDSDYGITLDCGNKFCSCTAVGHGKNETEAFKIVEEKCKFGMKKS